MSVQNHFWFYDEREMGLVRVDAQLRQTAIPVGIDNSLVSKCIRSPCKSMIIGFMFMTKNAVYWCRSVRNVCPHDPALNMQA